VKIIKRREGGWTKKLINSPFKSELFYLYIIYINVRSARIKQKKAKKSQKAEYSRKVS